MRLFVAAEIGEQLEEQAMALIVTLQKRAADIAPHAKITWVGAGHLHITVRFIGEVDEGLGAAIRAALEPALDVPPFELTLAGTGAFPKSGPPRVLWTGVEEGEAGLIASERSVSSRLATLGIPAEDRPYRPHLTLARVREAAGLRSSSLLKGLEELRLGMTRVDTITLFQSRLSPKGSTYTRLLRMPLGRPA